MFSWVVDLRMISVETDLFGITLISCSLTNVNTNFQGSIKGSHDTFNSQHNRKQVVNAKELKQ